MRKIRMDSSNGKNKSIRILLVDNDSDNTSLFRMVLEDNGFVVDVFNDSTLASSNFKPGRYELIILDICMPKMNGLELCREIRKINDKVKVCFLTASEMYKENLTSLQELDQNRRYFISKPIALDDFVNRVKQELNETQILITIVMTTATMVAILAFVVGSPASNFPSYGGRPKEVKEEVVMVWLITSRYIYRFLPHYHYYVQIQHAIAGLSYKLAKVMLEAGVLKRQISEKYLFRRVFNS